MKKLLSVFLTLCCALAALRVPACAEPAADEVNTSACAYALYCVNNGEFLLSDNADERLPMASTTKVMTALLTLEAAAEENRTVTFSEEMIAEGSSMYLEIGEELTLFDLAVGMLMQSGNDAANAAAVALSGSVDAFAAVMNARAASLGMTDTRYVTPSGLDAEGHYTTAHDLAILMDEAMKNPDFAAITGQSEMTVTFSSPEGKTVTCPNHNKLLRLYDGCIGGKTGFTDAAGRCLVTCAERDGLRLIAVTLDDPDDWEDHISLYDYGFEHYRAFTPAQISITADVVGGEADSVPLSCGERKSLVLERVPDQEPETRICLPPFLYAPLISGEEVGRVVIRYAGRTVCETPLYPLDDVPYT